MRVPALARTAAIQSSHMPDQSRYAYRLSYALRTALAYLVVAMTMCLVPTLAGAQVYSDFSPADLDDGVTCPGTPLRPDGTFGYVTRTFQVDALQDITRLDVGILANHTYRGNIQLQIIPPGGTPITLIESAAEPSDHYNVLLRTGAATLVNTGDHSGNQNLGGDYQVVAPNNAIPTSAYANTQGTWTVRACNDQSSVRRTGILGQVELFFFRSANTDVALDVTTSNATPRDNTTTRVTYTLTNDGSAAQTNIEVRLDVPSGMTMATGTPTASSGSFSGSIWSLPSLGPGASQTLTFQVADVGTEVGRFDGEVILADDPDRDSIPGNDLPEEDDQDFVEIFPQPAFNANVAPLDCSANNPLQFQWSETGANQWPRPVDEGGTGSRFDNRYTSSGTDPIDVRMRVFGDTQFLRRTGQDPRVTPYTQSNFRGGQGVDEVTVLVTADFDTAQRQIEIRLDLNNAQASPSGQAPNGDPGVDALQFIISDIDQGGFVDRITVRGSIDGTPVAPTLTPASSRVVRVAPNSVRGTPGNATGTESFGNVTVAFNRPVDTVVLVYDNHPDVGNFPSPQAIAVHNFDMCARSVPNLTATKSVETANPGDFATPGNDVIYRITVTNRSDAQAPATNISIRDILPEQLIFQGASADGFTNGTVVKPATNTDCNGGACVVGLDNGTLSVAATGVIRIDARIK